MTAQTAGGQPATLTWRAVQLLIRMQWPLRLLGGLGKDNPFRPERRIDPYPAYHKLRAQAPVYFHPGLRMWILTRHADIAEVLRDARFSVDRTKTQIFKLLDPFRPLSPDFTNVVLRSLLMLDPPEHTRIRTLVNKAFTPRVAEALRPRVQQIVDQLLDAVEPQGRMELIHDLAYPLPVIVIAELLGVPAEDRARFKEWSDELTILLDPIQDTTGLVHAQAAFTAMRDYFLAIFAARRREPRGDLISALVAVEEQGTRLSETELIAVCGLILGAGHETTTNLIGNAVIALLRNPGERERLCREPERIASAVEEFLRYDSPVQATDRVALTDCEIGGRRIRAGQVVSLLLGAGNRDPAQFPDPDRLDIARADNRHLSFGQGIHFCLGAALARVEAQVVISALLHRFPHFTGDPSACRWKQSMVLRGVEELQLELTGAAQ